MGDFRAQERNGNHNPLGVAAASRKFPNRAMSCNPEISPIVAEIEILSILFKSLIYRVK